MKHLVDYRIYTEREKAVRIIKTDITNDLSEFFLRRKILSAFDQCAEIVTKDPPVQFVPRIRKEASAVRQHADRQADRI